MKSGSVSDALRRTTQSRALTSTDFPVNFTHLKPLSSNLLGGKKLFWQTSFLLIFKILKLVMRSSTPKGNQIFSVQPVHWSGNDEVTNYLGCRILIRLHSR